MTTTTCDICGKPITSDQDFQSGKSTTPVLKVHGAASPTFEAWRCDDAHAQCIISLVNKVKKAIPAYIMQIKQEFK